MYWRFACRYLDETEDILVEAGYMLPPDEKQLKVSLEHPAGVHTGWKMGSQMALTALIRGLVL